MEASEIMCLESCTDFLKVRGKSCISTALFFGGHQSFCFFNYMKERKAPGMNVSVPMQQAHAAKLLFKLMRTQTLDTLELSSLQKLGLRSKDFFQTPWPHRDCWAARITSHQVPVLLCIHLMLGLRWKMGSVKQMGGTGPDMVPIMTEDQQSISNFASTLIGWISCNRHWEMGAVFWHLMKNQRWVLVQGQFYK